MINRSRISGKALSGLEGLLEMVGLRLTTKSIGAGTHLKSWTENVPDFRSCKNRWSCGRQVKCEQTRNR